jgi:hypothetical protein
MAEPPHIIDFGLLKPLSIRDRLRGERMSAAAGKPLPSCTPTSVLRPWRRRSEKRPEPLSREAKPKFPPLATNRNAIEPPA